MGRGLFRFPEMKFGIFVLATMGFGIISLTVALVLAVALGFGAMLHFGVDNNGLELCPRHANCTIQCWIVQCRSALKVYGRGA